MFLAGADNSEPAVSFAVLAGTCTTAALLGALACIVDDLHAIRACVEGDRPDPGGDTA